MNVLFLIKIYYKMLNKLRIHRLKLTFLKWIIGTHRKLTHSRGVQKMIGLLLLHHILEIENSLYLCNGSSDHDESLQERVDWGRKQCGKLKLAYFRNSRWRTAAILKIVNVQYLRNRSSDHDEIFHQYADCGCKSAEG